jgi:Spy/CpxP family protein refolding chaperone
MLDLSEEQVTEIRAVIAELSPKIEELQLEAQQKQEELHELVGPDYDEAVIREKADELGKLTAGITANGIILQSKVDSIFTAEQREKLEELERQQMEMQQQMQQQQMQQMMQQQMQQQLQQQQP